MTEMDRALTEIGISLGAAAISIVFLVIRPYKRARERYRRELGF